MNNADRFKQSVTKYVNLLELNNYEVHIKEKEMKHCADLSVRKQAGNAFIYYGKEWIQRATEEAIDKTAFHEVFELLIIELIHMSKETYSEKKVETAVHEIVRRAENIVYKKIKL